MLAAAALAPISLRPHRRSTSRAPSSSYNPLDSAPGEGSPAATTSEMIHMTTNPNSRLRHRSSFELTRAEGSLRDPLTSAAACVCDWVLSKESQYNGSPVLDDVEENGAFPMMWEYAMPEDYRGGDYDADRWPALATATLRRANDGAVRVWVLEYDEPDAKREERRWHTTVCLERISAESCRVSIQSMCRTLDEDDTELPETIAAPSFVRSLLDMPGFVAKKGTTPLAGAPIKLHTDTFDQFATSLTDPGREVPLVLFSTGYDGKVPEQAKQLARRALGIANVYILDWSDEPLREMLLGLFVRDEPSGEYSCPRSSCRMYMPGVDLTDPNHSMGHESFTREVMAAQLPSRFAESLARRLISNTPVRDIASLYDEAE